MNIIEAAKSGLPFKRKGDIDRYWIVIKTSYVFAEEVKTFVYANRAVKSKVEITPEDLLADDFEVKDDI